MREENNQEEKRENETERERKTITLIKKDTLRDSQIEK